MNQKNRLIILTGPIRSGKTTSLKKWLSNRPAARGVLTPDIEGIRFFLHFPDKKLIKMQIQKAEEASIKVGRFLFSKESFDEINRLLMRDIDSAGDHWIVIDEIGSLELKGGGLLPTLKYAMKHQNNNLIIVVRDKLLDQVVEQFDLKKAKVILKEDLALY